VEGADAEQLTKRLLDVLEKSSYTNGITAASTEQKIRRWMRRMHLIRRDVPPLPGILRQALWEFEEKSR
jgi:tRNA C32,U32 (ribose-2'-O)-methylase TrmJ